MKKQITNPGTDESQFVYNIENEEGLIDIKRYIGLYLSNWYWFALALFIAGIFAYGINTYSERVYIISSSILINDDQGGTNLTGLEKLIPGGDIFKSQQNLKNEIGILKSFSLNYEVIKQLPDFHVSVIGIGRRGISENRYYKNAPFLILYDSIDKQRIGETIEIVIKSDSMYTIKINGHTGLFDVHFGEKFSQSGYNFTLKKDSTKFRYNHKLSNKFKITFNKVESLANFYRGKLMIDPVSEDATLVNLTISGVNFNQECEYLNKLMDVYIKHGLDYKNETAQKTIEFIDDQLKIISDSLSIAATRLENFRRNNHLPDLSAESIDIKNRLENATQEKVNVTLQKQYYTYLSDYITSKNESGDIISPSIWGITDQLLIRGIDELSSLQKQKKQLNYSMSANQPAVLFIESQISEARNALAENVTNSINTVQKSLEDVNSRISIIEKDLNNLPGIERRLIEIQRKFDLNNTVYNYMLEKRSEASIAKASKVSNNRIIDYAKNYNAVQIKPQKRKNYLIAILFGIVLPALYITIVDRIHNKILDRKDIERETDAPIIGFVGHNFANNEVPVLTRSNSSLAESFRTIRANLKYYLKGKDKAIISITSTLSGEGKTFVSTNLSAIISTLGKKTLLIGLDLRKPRMHRILGTSNSIGLSSYLIGDSQYEDIVLQTEYENLFFVPSGPVPPNPAELIESERMKSFMDRVSSEYDFVIFDTPPIAVVSDGLILGQYADLNLFVVRQRYSYVNTLELIQTHLVKRDLKNIALIVNDISVKGYYGYGLRYGYGFYEGYGDKYGYGNYSSYVDNTSSEYYSKT